MLSLTHTILGNINPFTVSDTLAQCLNLKQIHTEPRENVC